MPDFPDRIKREIGDKFGERPSVLDFIPASQHTAIRAGSSSTDLTRWIQDGLDSQGTAGGGVLYLPWGTYPVLDLSIPSNVALVGDGGAKTVLKRRGTLPTGRGVLNLSGSKSGFSDLAIDGQVTTPATALYSGLSDPSASTLIANSSVRIHPGAKDISLSRFRIFHTGGYAVHIDCRTGNVYRITIDEPDFHDNRSFLFGATGGSEIYGSWTGGILAQGDGLTNPYALHGFTVRNGRFRRGTGNQIWSHAYGFSTLHSDFKLQGNSFQDIGRDGILVGAAVGGDISGNNFRRIGYVCIDDTNPGVPRWINGQWAVGLDTAGLTRGVNFLGNTFVSCYGAAMDLDGFAEGSVSDNTVIVPQSGEPEYSEDSVASWAGNYCYGAQTSNSNNLAAAAVGVKVTNNRFRNCGLGAVRLYAARKCTVSGNTIEHPASASTAPIILGNIGSGDNQRAGGNTVTDNDIYYSPGAMVGVVQEDPNGFAFTSADINRVYGNRMHGTNVFEFYRDANSASTTAQEFASNKAALTTASKNTFQREDGYLRAYWTSGATTKSVFSLLDRVSLSGGGFGGSLLNVSTDAVGGVIATGARTTSAFDDAVLSSKLYADGFLAIAATTFNATEANLLADTVGLLRYNATTKIFEQSNSVASGARVWSAIGGSSLSGLTAGRVPFTTGASSIADSANLAWDNTNRVLTVTGVTATASIVAATSFMQAAEGFYTPSSSASAIGAPAGGVTALSLISVRNDGAAGLTLARSSATARQYGLGIDASGNFFLRDQTAAAVRLTMSTAGLVTFGSSVSIDQSGNLSASAVVSAAGANISGTSYNSLQVPSGGLYAGLGATLDQALYLKTFAGTPNNPGAGYGGWSHRSGSTYLFWNGSAWTTVDLTTVGAGVTSITGTTNQVIASAATGAVTLSLPQNIHTAATVQFGTVAIGASSSVPLYVTGQSSNEVARFQGRTDASNNRNYFSLYTSNTAFWWEVSNQDASGGGTTNGIAFSERSGSGSALPRFYLAQGGLVGVNTLNPDGRLSVVESTAGNKMQSWRNNGNGTNLKHWQMTIGSAGEMSWSSINDAISAEIARPLTLLNGGTAWINRTTDDGSGGALQVAGFVSATTGFATVSSATDSIKSTLGGVTARFLIGTRSFTLTADTAANAGLSGGTTGRIYFDSTSNKFRVSENGGAYVDLLSSSGVTSITGTTNQVIASAATGAVTLSLPQDIHTGATPTFAGVVATVFNSTATGATIGFQLNNSNFQVNGNGVVSSAGGINVSGTNVISSARSILATQLQVDSSSLDSQMYVSSGAPRIALGNHATYASRTQATRWVMATAGGHFGLPAAGDAFLFTEGLGAGSPGNLYLGAGAQQTLKLDTSNDATFGRRGIFAGLAASAGLTLSAGWVDAADGFYTAVASYEALKATSGGVSVRSLHASAYSQVGSGSSAPTATSGSALAAGALYWDTGVAGLRVYNGSTWSTLATGGGITSLNSQTGPSVSIAAGTAISVSASSNTVTVTNTGVTALAGTSNQVSVSGATGSITLSLPQNIHTSASPTFYSLTTSDAIQSNRSTGPSIYAPNAYIQSKGFVSSGLSAYNSIQSDAGISAGSGANGGFYVASSQVINTSGQFVGLGINMPSYGIAASAFNPYSGSQYYGQTQTSWKTITDVRDNAGTSEYKYRTIDVRGGVVTSISAESGWTTF